MDGTSIVDEQCQIYTSKRRKERRQQACGQFGYGGRKKQQQQQLQAQLYDADGMEVGVSGPPLLPHGDDPRAVRGNKKRKRKNTINEGFGPFPAFFPEVRTDLPTLGTATTKGASAATAETTPSSSEETAAGLAAAAQPPPCSTLSLPPEVLPAGTLPDGFPPELSFRALAAWSLLRTLSIPLRLSPFTPNVFLRALLLPYPSRLMGIIHVELLRVLLTSLQAGYHWDESPSSSSSRGTYKFVFPTKKRGDGLRWPLRASDNLEYLDRYTWPVFFDDYCHMSAHAHYDAINSQQNFVDLASLDISQIRTVEEQERELLDRRHYYSTASCSKKRPLDLSTAERGPAVLYLNDDGTPEHQQEDEDEFRPDSDLDDENDDDDDDEYFVDKARRRSRGSGGGRGRGGSGSGRRRGRPPKKKPRTDGSNSSLAPSIAKTSTTTPAAGGVGVSSNIYISMVFPYGRTIGPILGQFNSSIQHYNNMMMNPVVLAQLRQRQQTACTKMQAEALAQARKAAAASTAAMTTLSSAPSSPPRQWKHQQAQDVTPPLDSKSSSQHRDTTKKESPSNPCFSCPTIPKIKQNAKIGIPPTAKVTVVSGNILRRTLLARQKTILGPGRNATHENITRPVPRNLEPRANPPISTPLATSDSVPLLLSTAPVISADTASSFVAVQSAQRKSSPPSTQKVAGHSGQTDGKPNHKAPNEATCSLYGDMDGCTPPANDNAAKPAISDANGIVVASKLAARKCAISSRGVVSSTCTKNSDGFDELPGDLAKQQRISYSHNHKHVQINSPTARTNDHGKADEKPSIGCDVGVKLGTQLGESENLSSSQPKLQSEERGGRSLTKGSELTGKESGVSVDGGTQLSAEALPVSRPPVISAESNKVSPTTPSREKAPSSTDIIRNFIRGKGGGTVVSEILDVEGKDGHDQYEGDESYPFESSHWQHFEPLKRMRRGAAYHRLTIEDKLRILEFLLDDLLTLDGFREEFQNRHSLLSQFDYPYGKLPSSEELDNIVNEDECAVCLQEGELLCCDGCTSSYHRSCLDMGEFDALPDGRWLCPECRLPDAAKFGPLFANKPKATVDWVSLNDIKISHRLSTSDGARLCPAELIAASNNSEGTQEKYLVTHGFVFAQQIKDRLTLDLKTLKHGYSQPVPLCKEAVQRRISALRIIPTSWPFAQIPADASYFGQCETFDPSAYETKYRRAPASLPYRVKYPYQSDFEYKCRPSATSSLSNMLSWRMNNDRAVAKALVSPLPPFNPFRMIKTFMQNLEADLTKGCLVDEFWGLRNSKKGDQRTWFKNVEKCSSVQRLSSLLVDLVDATHPRAFCVDWFQPSTNKLQSFSAVTGVLNEAKAADVIDLTTACVHFAGEDGETVRVQDAGVQNESLRRLWERSSTSDITTLLAKESCRARDWMRELRPELLSSEPFRNKRKLAKSVNEEKRGFHLVEDEKSEKEDNFVNENSQTSRANVAEINRSELDDDSIPAKLRNRQPSPEGLKGLTALPGVLSKSDGLLLNEKSIKMTELVETAKILGTNEVQWPVAGRRFFDPIGYLPRGSGGIKRLARNAGVIRAPFCTYASNYEVAQVSMYHIWRKKMKNCVSYEELILYIRILQSFLDTSIIRKSTSAARRSKKGKSSSIVCTHVDCQTGLMYYLLFDPGKVSGRWMSTLTVEVNPLVRELKRRRKFRTDNFNRKWGDVALRDKAEASARKKATAATRKKADAGIRTKAKAGARPQNNTRVPYSQLTSGVPVVQLNSGMTPHQNERISQTVLDKLQNVVAYYGVRIQDLCSKYPHGLPSPVIMHERQQAFLQLNFLMQSEGYHGCNDEVILKELKDIERKVSNAVHSSSGDPPNPAVASHQSSVASNSQIPQVASSDCLGNEFSLPSVPPTQMHAPTSSSEVLGGCGGVYLEPRPIGIQCLPHGMAPIPHSLPPAPHLPSPPLQQQRQHQQLQHPPAVGQQVSQPVQPSLGPGLALSTEQATIGEVQGHVYQHQSQPQTQQQHSTSVPYQQPGPLAPHPHQQVHLQHLAHLYQQYQHHHHHHQQSNSHHPHPHFHPNSQQR